MTTPETSQPTGGTQAPSPSPEPIHMPKRPLGPYIIAGALIGGALIIANLTGNDVPASDNGSADTLVDSSTSQMVITIDAQTGEETKIDVSDFVTYVGTDDFSDLKEATTIINTAQGKPTSGSSSEQITFGVVPSSEQDMVYFATTSTSEETGDLFAGVYHYNTITNRWQRVYKQTFEAQEDAAPSMLRVLGRAGETLVVFQDRFGNSPGPCADPWLLADASGTLLAMDLSDPYGGLRPFPLPEQIKQQAHETELVCLQENFGS